MNRWTLAPATPALSSPRQRRRTDRFDRARRNKQLRLEFLEDRRQLAAGEAALVGNDLLAEGTTGDDLIIISQTSGGLYLARINENTFGPFVVPGKLIATGDDGNDFIVVINSTLVAELDGGDGDDYLAGSGGDDLLVGGLGNDKLLSAAGNNTVWGDVVGQQAVDVGGNDQISTGSGNDIAYGGGGHDSIFLQGGSDYAFGGFGNDLIGGSDGNDRLYGGEGDDTLAGDTGDDLLVGNGGHDILIGRAGLDLIIGGAGNDRLNGNEDADLLVGRGTTNEASTIASDANDLALTTALTTWVATTPTGLLTAVLGPDDAGLDTLAGNTGNDVFYADQLDRLGDFSLNFMGNDRLEVFPGSAALPPGSPVAAGTAALVGSDLVVQGTPLGDRILVYPASNGSYYAKINNQLFGPFVIPGTIQIEGGDGDDNIEVINTTLAAIVNGGLDNDYIATSAGDDIISGGLGNDIIQAGEGTNTVWGDNQNEQLVDAGGFDTITAGAGNDVIYGGGGNDELHPGAGDDYVSGGFGNDLISGFTGNDRLYGGEGDDTISGDVGDDLLIGNGGNDTLIGRAGRDVVIGSAGADRINGSEDNDTVIGRGIITEVSTTAGDLNDNSNLNLLLAWSSATPLGLFLPVLGPNDNAVDNIYGGPGNDDFYADQLDIRHDFRAAFMGNDTLQVFPGSAALPAGSIVAPGTAALVGNDLVAVGTVNGDRIIVRPAGPDTVDISVNGQSWGAFLVPGSILISGGDGDDSIQVISTANATVIDGGNDNDDIATSFGNDVITGGAGDDRIQAGDGNNQVWGDVAGQENANVGGIDRITTGAGNDIVYGGGGNDTINLGDGDDYAFGGFGDDSIGGGFGNDRLYGGAGNDVLSGEQGDDLLVGNAGNDRLFGRQGRDVVVGGIGADEVTGQEDSDALIGRSLTNEASTQDGDANDLALAALLSQWAASLPAGLFTPSLGANDGAKDYLHGSTAADDFYADVNDTLADFRAPGAGLDRRIL
jgi:Ca2+-binding RTX toxin-like protein